MKRFFLCLLPCFLIPARAQTAAPVLKLEQNEIALEGRIEDVNAAKNELRLEARSFQTKSGRQTFIKPKTKTLRLSAGTKLFDERTKRAATVADLKVGDLVRAVGRDGGSGKPLAVRFLRWSSTEAFDPDVPPALRSLLPPSEKWKGLDVRVVDAGFKPRAQLFPDANMAPQQISWMLALRNPQSDSLRLVEFETPDGSRRWANGQSPWPLADGTSGSAFEFADVNPRWKSVRARFELVAPNAPDDARGEISDSVPVEIPVPDAVNGVLKPGTKWKTVRGSTIELVRVEADDTQKHLRISWRYTPPSDAPDAAFSCRLSDLKSGDTPLNVQRSTSGSSVRPQIVGEELFTLPRGAVLKGNLQVSGSASAWRKTEFLHQFDFEFPVSKIAIASPPARLDNRPAPVEVEATQGKASLEASHREGPYAVLPLWLSANQGQANAKTGVEERLLLREVRVQPEGGEENTRTFHGSEGEAFWHDDLSPATQGETGWRVLVQTRKAQKVQISATAQLASIFEGDHNIQIPIPARGQTRSLEQDDVGDDVVNVRKAAWVEANRWKDNTFVRDNLHLEIGPRGALVVVCDLLRVWPTSERELQSIRLSDNTGKIYGDTVAWNGDLLGTGAMSPTVISFVVPTPADGAKSLNLFFHMRETSLGATAQFKFPNVELEAEAP